MGLFIALREKAGMFLLIFIAFALIAMLGLMLPGDFNPASLSNQNMVGKVDGKKIDYNAFLGKSERYTKDYVIQNGLNIGDLTDEQRAEIRAEAWTDTLTQIVKYDQYDDLGLTVTQDESGTLFASERPHPLARQFFGLFMENYDPTQVDQVVNNLSTIAANRPDLIELWDYVRKTVPKDYLDAKYKQAILGGLYVPQWMANQENENTGKTVDLSYVKIPFETISDDEVSVSDADLTNYINANKGQFKQKESRTIQYVTLQINPSEKDSLEQKEDFAELVADWSTIKRDSNFLIDNSEVPYNGQYKTAFELGSLNKDTFFTAPIGYIERPYIEGNSWKAMKVINRIMVPDSVKARVINVAYNRFNNVENAREVADAFIDSIADLVKSNTQPFDSIVAKSSDDRSTLGTGGSLGYIKRGALTQRYGSNMQNVEDTLFTASKVGDVKKLQTNVGFQIYLIEDLVKTTPAVKLGTLQKEIFYTKDTRRKVYNEANKFAAELNDGGNFNEVAASKNYTILTEEIPINAYQLGRLGAGDDVSQLLNWSFKAKKDEASPIYEIKDQFVIAKLSGMKEEGLAKVDDVREQVAAQVRKQKKAEKIKASASGSDLNGYASSYSATVQSATGLNFANPTLSGSVEPEVVATALGMQVGSTSQPIAGENGVYVVSVTSINEPTSDPGFAKQNVLISKESAIDAQIFPQLLKSVDVEDNRYKF